MKKDLKEITINNLTYPYLKNPKNELPNYMLGNSCVHTANLLCGRLGINDFTRIMKIAEFINSSWTDQEISEEQVESIIKFVTELKLSDDYVEKYY
jgi:hypothetical protein